MKKHKKDLPPVHIECHQGAHSIRKPDGTEVPTAGTRIITPRGGAKGVTARIIKDTDMPQCRVGAGMATIHHKK